jgi:hypothetical protein
VLGIQRGRIDRAAGREQEREQRAHHIAILHEPGCR